MIKDFDNEGNDTPSKIASKEKPLTHKQASSPGKPAIKKPVTNTTQSKTSITKKSSNQSTSGHSSVNSIKNARPKPVAQNIAQLPAKVSLKPPAEPTYGSRGLVTDTKMSEVRSASSRISAITEESETTDDFYEQIMAKYGIELSDDDSD